MPSLRGRLPGVEVALRDRRRGDFQLNNAANFKEMCLRIHEAAVFTYEKLKVTVEF